eukprot:CAMPEP_0172390254 /NCGR_PEP_ID=MMETSP1061-20121228/6930_1 /TAXON_ID=37318 /ORGANISM="Pseudo-nitzschia pungens, Strain cf. pungens" /LENGTH=236 /DNA_ID=CAMNT_0013120569 /DNA_START=213 /DNA_END=924 /DNA_ORIENTATION=+
MRHASHESEIPIPIPIPIPIAIAIPIQVPIITPIAITHHPSTASVVFSLSQGRDARILQHHERVSQLGRHQDLVLPGPDAHKGNAFLGVRSRGSRGTAGIVVVVVVVWVLRTGTRQAQDVLVGRFHHLGQEVRVSKYGRGGGAASAATAARLGGPGSFRTRRGHLVRHDVALGVQYRYGQDALVGGQSGNGVVDFLPVHHVFCGSGRRDRGCRRCLFVVCHFGGGGGGGGGCYVML